MENTMSELKEYLDRLGISTEGKTTCEVNDEIASVWKNLQIAKRKFNVWISLKKRIQSHERFCSVNYS